MAYFLRGFQNEFIVNYAMLNLLRFYVCIYEKVSVVGTYQNID